MQPSGVITITTDFGHKGPFTAVMKGVIMGRFPDAKIIDLIHDIPAQWPPEAGFWVSRAYKYFPAGTVHLAIVDPGVGTERDILLVQHDRHYFMAPDNGLLSPILEDAEDTQVFKLDLSCFKRLGLDEPSATFHGRDIFAPAAAHLSLGLPLEKLGPAVHYRMHFPGRLILREQDRLQGEIIHVDRFGNLISNIEILSAGTERKLLDLQVTLATEQVLTGPGTYEEAPPLRPFTLIGSSGLLEVSVRNGSAHKVTGCGVGTPVVVRRQR